MTPPRSYRRRVLLGALSTGAANAWSMVVVLASLPLVLNGLGTEVFGTWVLLQTFSAVTGWFALADLGVGIATTRRVAEHLSGDDAKGAGSVIDSALVLFVGLAVAGGLLLGLGGRAWFPTWFRTPDDLADDLVLATGLFAVQVALEIVIEGMEACLEGLQRIDLSRLADSIRFTAAAVAVVVAAQTSGTLAAVAAASLGATVFGFVVATGLLVAQRPRGAPIPATGHARSLLRYGPTVGVLNATGVVHRSMDRLIVGVILGPAAVTLVEIATQIQNGASAVLSATAYTATSAAPWLKARRAVDQLRELLLRGTRYSMIVTTPFIVLAVVLAGPLVDVWMSADYADAAGLTQVAMLSVAFAAPLAVGSNALVGMGHAARVLVPAAIAVVVNLGVSVWAVHRIGTVGAFIGTLAGAVVITPLLGRAVLVATGVRGAELGRVSLFPVVVPAAACAAAAGGALLLFDRPVIRLLVGAAAGATAYVVVVLRVTLDRGEVGDLLGSLRRR